VPPAQIVGGHVLECDQVDFKVELVNRRPDFVRLLDFAFDDVASEAGLQPFNRYTSVRFRETYSFRSGEYTVLGLD
jgi:hypothetical protein